ncbi:Holliday junction branch migration protein RuvA [Paenibacillus albiflavus]|uniref:Holliday junction branch migration complex subunit RuvA n=1 Tax=Paenibacillus albiflavus TaxID=2545760 RepID=A0A4V6P697_9BACL|nr:Holliday junction branch migration protein RuvA [Paenibacillus albiflavus]TCZ75122.1 Holliday junction branch migration protein RuvA [Paenibacillus albiflavus]
MIDFVRGILACREMEYVVVDVNGIGYRVWCPNPFLPSLQEGKEVTFYIHYHVREDAHLLYGFTTREEQQVFRKLLGVSGIGPKVALGALSGAKPEAVITAIQNENVNFLTKLPGIGKKTAQRIVLDLKDKLGMPEGASLLAHDLGLGDDGINTGKLANSWSEAKEALLGLGYNESEADRALAAIRGKCADTEPVEVIMRHALQALFKL